MSSLCASKSKRILKIRYLLKRPFITSKIPRIFSALIFVKSILCAPVHSFCKPPQHFNEVVTTVCKQLALEKQRISFRVNSWKKLSYFCSFLFQIGTLCWQGKPNMHIAYCRGQQTDCMFSHQLSTNERQDAVHWTGHQRDFGKETLDPRKTPTLCKWSDATKVTNWWRTSQKLMRTALPTLPYLFVASPH